MIETRVTEAFRLSSPILSAGMAFVSRPRLAAAVSNAGGMGFVGADMTPPEGVARLIAATRELTRRPFGVDFMAPFFTEEHLQVCLTAPVAAVTFIWGYPNWEWVEKLQQTGAKVWMKVSSLEQAKGALQCGLDGLVVEAPQGPGPMASSLMSLLPAIVDAVRLPVIASGGIVDGRGLAASLALGAEAVRCGTRFLDAVEADAQSEYERRFGSSNADEIPLVELFSPEWPEEPERPTGGASAENRTASRVEGQRAAGGSNAADQALADHGLTITKLTRVLTAEREVEFEDVAFGPNGDKDSKVAIRPAAEIVREMTREAERILAKYTPLVAVA